MDHLCPACGAPYSPGEKFCQNCGTRLPEYVPAAPVEEAPAAPVNEAPAAPVYEAPAAPVYEAPAAEPAYEATTALLSEEPAAPAYAPPAAPVYEAPAAPVPPVPPAAPAYEAPAYPNYQAAPNYAPNYAQGAPAYAPNGMPNYADPRAAAPNYAAAPAAAPKKKHTGLIITLCAVGVLIAALVVSYFFLFTPNSVALSAESLNVKLYDPIQLTAEVSPSIAFLSKDITWTSSDENIATVAEDGTVNTWKAGTCEITATTGNGKSATCTLTVEVDPTNLYLSETIVDLEVGESLTLIPEVLPKDATNYTITWTSDDPFVATVTDGKITAVSDGSCIITATISDDVKATCSVTVGVAPESLSLSEFWVDLRVGETVELETEVSPENATNYTITWTSDDESVATVSDGKITAVGEGSCTIKAAISDEIYTTCWVDVSEAGAVSEYDQYILGEWKLALYYDYETQQDIPAETLGVSSKLIINADHTASMTWNNESTDELTWIFDYVDDWGDYCFTLDDGYEGMPFDYIVDEGEIWLYLDYATLTYRK